MNIKDLDRKKLSKITIKVSMFKQETLFIWRSSWSWICLYFIILILINKCFQTFDYWLKGAEVQSVYESIRKEER